MAGDWLASVIEYRVSAGARLHLSSRCRRVIGTARKPCTWHQPSGYKYRCFFFVPARYMPLTFPWISIHGSYGGLIDVHFNFPTMNASHGF